MKSIMLLGSFALLILVGAQTFVQSAPPPSPPGHVQPTTWDAACLQKRVDNCIARTLYAGVGEFHPDAVIDGKKQEGDRARHCGDSYDLLQVLIGREEATTFVRKNRHEVFSRSDGAWKAPKGCPESQVAAYLPSWENETWKDVKEKTFTYASFFVNHCKAIAELEEAKNDVKCIVK